LSGDRPPVRVRSSPLRGGCGVTAASEVVILAVPVRIRSAAPAPRPTRVQPWGCSSMSAERLACTEEDVGSNPTVSISSLRSVNGKARARRTAEVRVRLLPEAPSRARSSADESAVLRRQRTLVRVQPGVLRADVAQVEEHRTATPETPVRLGSSACTSPWCNGSTTSSNLAGPGSNPGGFACPRWNAKGGESREAW
jgi:hypothetical protein